MLLLGVEEIALQVYHISGSLSRGLQIFLQFPQTFFQKPLDKAIRKWYNIKRCRGIAQLVEQRSPKPRVQSSSLCAPAIIIGQKRSDRENKRKREISRDFSRFFAPTFFQSFIDPFSGFHRVERNELWIEPFFPNLQSKTNDRKDLNPRQGFNFFRFFALDTNCLQTNHYKISPSLLRKDPNPRNLEKLIFQKQSIVKSEGFEPTKTKY